MNKVHVRIEPIILPTYEPAAADPNPMFFERRVYQGSSGKIYPLPLIDRIAEEKKDRSWTVVHLENQFIKLEMLPEIGGRIFTGQDKTNGYDFFYRQQVIKPALVALAGPWISGGVEFNWPQHHRLATFLPVETHVEHHRDGSVTVWFSDHDPMSRMKGMHGVCLHPDRAVVEVKVRAYNRTPHVQTFLWWANVGARVDEHYQSFFPPDVGYVADHAKRATSTFPLCSDHYYGVDYASRAKEGVPKDEPTPDFVPPGTYPLNDLSWYANIPVPTSYMAMGSREDFFGGYDHQREAGLVHYANHHIAPGKKQWTWGNHPFGYAWDRLLTDEDGPYIELMAGVYTDNQPDFSFLMPGETKTWSQYWYPIQKTGPVQQANLDAALRFTIEKNKATIAVSATTAFPGATILLTHKARVLKRWTTDLAPGASFSTEVRLPAGKKESGYGVNVIANDGRKLVSYEIQPIPSFDLPGPATEPPLPAAVESTDELYITGLHLDQYRHATRNAVDYWREALRRDPGDVRCNTSMGVWHLRRGEWTEAESHLRAAIARSTRRNPNPYDGEIFYQLGMVLRYQQRDEEAYDAFYKATWNQAWQATAYQALAEIDARRGDDVKALEHLDRSLRMNTDHLRARCLRAMILRRTGSEEKAMAQLRANLELDPLDAWTRILLDERAPDDPQMRLDVVNDVLRAGFDADAMRLLEGTDKRRKDGSGPMIRYYQAYVARRLHRVKAAARFSQQAAKCDPTYCFPARLEDLLVLEDAIRHDPKDARAPYYLGNTFYDRKRYLEAIHCWEQSVQLNPTFATAWRNLGIAYFNVLKKDKQALRAYDNALRANPKDARILYERDQLWKRLRIDPIRRLRELKRYPKLVNQRDDLTLEYGMLLNQAGWPEQAHALIQQRRFQPWEGGEGMVLALHVRTHLLLAKKALAQKQSDEAIQWVKAALNVPDQLGEGRHFLANTSDIFLTLGDAFHQAGQKKEALSAWQQAAQSQGDFKEMSVRTVSELTWYSACAMQRLGRKAAAQKRFREILEYGKTLEKTPAKIDYFATSLPTLLLFNEDLQERQTINARFLQAQAYQGLNQRVKARKLLSDVLERDPAHPMAKDLLNEC